MQKLAFVQVGETALRSPCGAPLACVPLYIKAEHIPRLQLNPENHARDICGFFYEKYKKEPNQSQMKSPPTPTKVPADFTDKRHH